VSGPAFRLQDVRRVFRDGESERVVLKGISLEIPEGKFLSIEGTSGSGKSTLLSILGGLDSEYQGNVEVFGHNLAAMKEKKRAWLRNTHLGFVFQSFHLLSHLSVLQNVEAPALFAEDTFDSRAAAQRALEQVGLLDRADDYPNYLSGGQRQRVALARALLRSPKALLCDEPTGNLDSKTGQGVIQLLQSLHDELGTTILVVTHDAKLAEQAEMKIRIVDGQIA
jgi:putative ABC transport system ATP-binding protein